MGIRKRKPAGMPARPRQQPQPVASRYAAEVRQHAEKLADPVENSGKNGARVRNHQRHLAEQKMAQLRGDAVQARRLAEHIEYLSQDTATYKHKRKHVMTDTTIIDPGHAQRQQRRTADKPGSSGKQLNFNPLHPSMELPPEQLIRLLGMESKKIRRSRKKTRTPKPAATAPETTGDTEGDNTPPPAKARPQAVRPADPTIQYERCEPPQVFDNGFSGLLVPSLLVGVVAGIALSGYLFWYQPADTAIQKTPVPAVATQPEKSAPNRQLVQRKPAPATPVAAPATIPKMSAKENAAWRATVEAQEQRLQTAAEQRLAERVTQLQQASRQAEVQPAPVSNTLPVPAPEPETQQDPVFDGVTPMDSTLEAPFETTSESSSDTPVSEPVPAAIETLDVQELPAEIIRSDTRSLPVTPGESAEVMPANVEAIPVFDDAETDVIQDERVSAAPVTPADEPPATTANDGLF